MGRHRLGTGAALCHCRDLPDVRIRLAERRAAAPRPQLPPSAVLALLLAILTLLTGWLFATGADAFASIVAL
jgi:hypothetical protein